MIATGVALTALLCVPALAEAATSVSRSGPTLVITGAGSDASTINVTRALVNVGGLATPHYFVSDTAGVTPGSGCTSSSGAARCNALGITAISADLGNGNDAITLSRTTHPVPADISSSLGGGDGNDTLNGGDGPDTMNGGSQADAFNAFGGTDTVSYANHPGGSVTVDIGAGGANDGNHVDGPVGSRDNVTADVENLVGGLGSDTFTGNEGPNRLDGGSGDDTLRGGFGADTVVGGPGFDRASYTDRTSASVAITADIGGGSNDGDPTLNGGTGEGDDIGSDVEGLTGGAGDDQLTGSDEPNSLRGHDGDDTLYGLGGADAAGTYLTSTQFGCATFSPPGEISGGDGDDHLYGGGGPDGLFGGAGEDVLEGDEGEDRHIQNLHIAACFGESVFGGLFGESDNDTLDGGFGADDLVGGPDTDEVTYNDRTAGVVVDIDDGADDGNDDDLGSGSRRDDVKFVEELTGGSGDDALTGAAQGVAAAQGEVLTGGDGADTLFGLGGGDTLHGNAGSDILNGGAAVDTFDAGTGDDQAQAFDGNAENVDCGADTDSYTADTAGVVDTLIGCETNLSDGDVDGVPDVSDNCAAISNPDQKNNDGDATGDACDADDDNDGDLDDADNCPLDANADQADADNDGDGDACDADDDDDTLEDPMDSCPALGGAGSESGCPRQSRSLTLGYSPKRKRFKGGLTSAEPQCIGGQTVTIFKQRAGDDLEVGEATTGENGGYQLRRRARRGVYYSTVERSVIADLAECDPASSPLFRVSRR